LLAASKNHLDAVRVLVDAGADVTAKDIVCIAFFITTAGTEPLASFHIGLRFMFLQFGNTLLLYAAKFGWIKLAQRLLAHSGVDVNAFSRVGASKFMPFQMYVHIIVTLRVITATSQIRLPLALLHFIWLHTMVMPQSFHPSSITRALTRTQRLGG
jgi:hypothetical protein